MLVELTACPWTGQGYAVKAGMLCARGELLLMADADGATVAAEAQRLEEALQKVKVSPAAAWNHGGVVPVSTGCAGAAAAQRGRRRRRGLQSPPPAAGAEVCRELSTPEHHSPDPALLMTHASSTIVMLPSVLKTTTDPAVNSLCLSSPGIEIRGPGLDWR